MLWLCDALTKLMQRKAGGSSPRVQPDHVFYSALELHFYQDYLLSATGRWHTCAVPSIFCIFLFGPFAGRGA